MRFSKLIFVFQFFYPLHISSSSSCNPDTKPLFGKFLLQRWADARKELGLNDPFLFTEKNDSIMLQYMQRVEFVINNVNSFTFGAKVFYNKDIPVPYVPILTCAENSIMSNLDDLTASKNSKAQEAKRSFQPLRIIKSQSQLELLLSAACITPEYQAAIKDENSLHNSNDTTNYSCSSIRTFTFVMDPFQRFAASYKECVWRYYFQRDRRSRDGSFMKINSSLVKEHFLTLLDFRFPKLGSAQLLYPLAGSLFSFHVDIVGHLDNFHQDWNTLIMPQYGFDAKTQGYNYDYGPKKSNPDPDYLKKREEMDMNKILLAEGESDNNNARKALTETFESDPKYIRALCHLLLIDYVCLPMYSLPPACAFLLPTRTKAKEAMDNKREIPPHMS